MSAIQFIPYAQLDGHRFRLAVGRDGLAVAAWCGPVCAFPLYPLREGREAARECRRRLGRTKSNITIEASGQL